MEENTFQEILPETTTQPASVETTTQLEQKTEIDPEELSAAFINQAHKEFKTLVYKLSERKKRATPRVLEAILFEPLEKVELYGQEEQDLFALCQEVMYHKGVVFKYAMQRMEKIKKGETVDGTTEEK